MNYHEIKIIVQDDGEPYSLTGPEVVEALVNQFDGKGLRVISTTVRALTQSAVDLIVPTFLGGRGTFKCPKCRQWVEVIENYWVRHYNRPTPSDPAIVGILCEVSGQTKFKFEPLEEWIK